MRAVFLSHATRDRREAHAICDAIERRGMPCWIAARDVQPGENYQEAIVRAIGGARAIVLVFSSRANDSDEIKKELSLASRLRLPVIALRIEAAEPGGAFAYELATRQWIDWFAGRDRAIDTAVRRIEQVAPAGAGEAEPDRARPSTVRRAPRRRRGPLILAAMLVSAALASVLWLTLPAPPATTGSMKVRLTAFDRLSPDVPATLPAAIRAEIIAAFGDDGAVAVSTAAAPPPGTTPAYALGGSVRRAGDTIRVIARLADERTGVTLWSNTFGFDTAEAPRIPRRIAVDAGAVVRCGLFGASTYPRPLPDAVLSNYLQSCHNRGLVAFEPMKALDLARKVVAAVPDFSWGWSAIGLAARVVLSGGGDAARALRREALVAADKAITLDPTNSEALAGKASLIDQSDLLGRDALFRRAMHARPLACGCEHRAYGEFLAEVGRTDAATAELRRSIDTFALDAATQATLGVELAMTGDADEAHAPIDAAVDLDGDPAKRDGFTVLLAPTTHDYAGAIRVLSEHPDFFDEPVRLAYLAAFRALLATAPQEKAAAARGLVALPADRHTVRTTVGLLGVLGANRQALAMIETAAATNVFGARTALFDPALAAARADPSFAPIVGRLGLIQYWRATRTRPDVCAPTNAPAFCRSI